MGLVSVRSSWLGESTDIQYDPFRSSRDLELTWPEVKLWPWPFKVMLYMVWRALTRQTRWYQNRCSTFKIKDFIVEKPFWIFFGILTPGDLNFDLNQKMTEMISKLFFGSFRTLPFVFLYGDHEPRSWGGGRLNTPSRRWKIPRPSRARVKHAYDNILPECEPSGSIILVPRAQNVKTPDFELWPDLDLT